MTSPRPRSRGRRVAMGAGLALAGSLAGSNAWIARVGKAHRVASVEALPLADAVVVLGAAATPEGTPSVPLGDRLDTGIEAYRAARAPKLLLTGDHGQRHYDEVNAMRRYALAAGVPPADVFCDHAGFSTYESFYRARAVFQVRRAVVVTHDFHLDRALYLATALGIDAWGIPCRERARVKLFGRAIREPIARVKAILWGTLRPEPTYLGAIVPITGDGRRSWDEGARAGRSRGGSGRVPEGRGAPTPAPPAGPRGGEAPARDGP